MTVQYPDRNRSDDENLWLEDIYGDRQLDWVRGQNARTLAMIDADALADSQARILEVYDSDDRIPMLTKHGDWYYNFWQDARNPRGIWRRTTLESYRSESPEWDIVLDIDQLATAEGKEWVFQGAELLPHAYQRALVRLSPDGGDAVEIREFDVSDKAFVEGGFFVPYAKGSTAWLDHDTILVATDFGEGSLTTSGYPRELRRWRRGEQLADAQVVHSVPHDHMTIGFGHDHTSGFERSHVVDVVDFFHRHWFLVEDGELIKIDVPDDAELSWHRDWLTIEPRSDWQTTDVSYPAGSLLAIRLQEFLKGSRDFEVVFSPDARTSLAGISWTRNHLILNLLQDVASQIPIATPGPDGWTCTELESLPLQTTSAHAMDEENSDDFWFMSTGFLQPTTLSIGEIGAEIEPLKSMPALFDADDLQVEQHFATSADGTRVPYFQVSRQDLVSDGHNPTLLYGYGGFEVSLRPGYDAAIGRIWLEYGGVYVIANIRGGGEYGPLWHTTALKENRHRAYDDFSAVARDLIARGVTSPDHLGCMGGSNGGLLVGNMLTHYPELFGAIVCTVPLLDMKRYVHLNAGASWIAEYGDPENPEEWAYIQTFSPYHNLRDGVDYPPVLFYTATSDDRVGPVQARKMAARMQAKGIPDVWFYENIHGGHGGAADNSQRAFMRAMTIEFLRQHIG